MRRGFARVIVRVASVLAPKDQRARWREEWLGELDAAPANMRTVRRAVGAFGDALAFKRQIASRQARGFAVLHGWRADAAHAVRLLRRRPSHTVAVVLCLAMGLTVSITVFSGLTSLLFGDQPGIPHRRDIVHAYLSYDAAVGTETVAGGAHVSADPLSLDDFDVLRAPGPAIGSLAAEGNLAMAAVGAHDAMGVQGAFVSGNYFDVLGTLPMAGRLLRPDDETPAADRVAVVSEYFWRTQLDARADAIGATLLLAGRAFRVVGVAPPRFHGLLPVDIGDDESHGTHVWMPLQHATGWPGTPARGDGWLTGIGRLRPGATIDDARAQLAVQAARLAAAFPSTRAHAAAVVRRHGFGPGDAPVQLLLVIGAILSVPLTVLAIGCANVANLQLARATERTRELAVRLAFGATRGQVLRLLTIETLALAAVAVGVSTLATSAIVRVVSRSFPFAVSVDWRVVAFSLVLLVGIAFATGLAPAWLALRGPRAARLHHAAQGDGLGHSRLRSALVIAQVALSLVMLCTSAIFLRSLNAMELGVPAALRAQFVADFDPAQVTGGGERARDFADRLSARMEADPRVTAVALTRSSRVRYGAPDGDRAADRHATLVEMTPPWLTVMKLPILTGRPLAAGDEPDAALVSAGLAGVLSPDGSPLGLVIRLNDGSATPRDVRIVGVVADNRARPMAAGDRPEPVVYVPLSRATSRPFSIRVSTPEVDAVAADFRAVVRDLDPQLSWLTLRRGEDVYLQDAGALRKVAMSIGALGLIALLLAATGLYAVMGYVVLLRRREIGVRMALGAAPGGIVAMVLRQSMALILVGGAIGFAIFVPAAFALRAVFVGPVAPLDPLIYVPALALLLGAGLVAAGLPARRAAHVDPITTLRAE